MVTIAWSNDSTTSAATWEALEEKVRLLQWHDWDAAEFRDAMSKRAWRWSGTRIEIGGGSREFFHELQRAAMVVIVKDDEGEVA